MIPNYMKWLASIADTSQILCRWLYITHIIINNISIYGFNGEIEILNFNTQNSVLLEIKLKIN